MPTLTTLCKTLPLALASVLALTACNQQTSTEKPTQAS